MHAELNAFLEANPHYTSIVLISDKNVFALYGDEIASCFTKPVYTILVEPGEKFKTLDSANFCWNTLHEKGCDRHVLICSLGGGVITDLAGFVAACYMRGVDVIHIPTTLLAMIDAAVGGKTGVNIASGKNIVGAFHQPKKVLIDTRFLKTLPQRDYIAGLAEIVKYAIITDSTLFQHLENEASRLVEKDLTLLDPLIKKCITIKSTIVAQDEKEKDLRAVLNLGHTFGHAIESSTAYQTYLHGEAVAIGLYCATYMSQLLNMIDRAVMDRLQRLLIQLKLPFSLPQISSEKLLHLMYGDKKTKNGKLNFILVQAIGKVIKVEDVKPDLVLKTLDDLKGKRLG